MHRPRPRASRLPSWRRARGCRQRSAGSGSDRARPRAPAVAPGRRRWRAAARRSRGPPALEHEGPPLHVERLHARFEEKVDALVRVPFRRAHRDPVVGRVPGEKILREVGPIVRGRCVGADHRDGPVVPFAAQHVRRGEAGGAAADDDDGRRRARGSGCRRSRQSLAHERDVAHLLDAPARNRIERRCAQRLARPQAEAGVVPRTAHRVTRDHAVGERPVVVRAMRAHGKQRIAAAHEQSFIVAHSPRDHRRVAQTSHGNAGREIGQGCIGFVRHRCRIGVT